MTPARWSRIKEIFSAALDTPESERSRLLESACAGDTEMRAEVERLLAGNEEPSWQSPAADLLAEPSLTQLSAGARLGHYQIVAMLGRGGMGVVYRARDTKLGREVAIKVLPDSLAQDPDRLARFHREAKLLASLNHPNIGQIYGVESQALVMELVEGETIASLMKSGPLPFETALSYVRQIAEALEAAHEKGIIHRDLKPANIMVTPAGVGKVLDFGLAKAEEPVMASDPSESPTAMLSPTRSGFILGTAAYMSPEQARGDTVDKRTDIWAFGVVLYEMLTGSRAFPGETVTDILAGVLRGAPDWSALPAATPPDIRKLLHRCLERDRRQRLQAIGEARIGIEAALAEKSAPVAEPRGTSVTGASGVLAKRRRRELVCGVLAVIFLSAAVIGAVLYWRAARPPAHAVIAEIAAPDKGQFNSSLGVGLSPDGHALAFSAADQSGKTMLWVRSLDSLAARALPGTEEATDPFWSADSRTLGFCAGNTLKSIPAAGGPVTRMADCGPYEAGGSWSQAGTLLYVPDFRKGVYKVAGNGANPLPVIPGDPHESSYIAFPRFLPDGKHFLYLSRGGDPASGGTYFASLDGKERRLLIGGNTFAIYASGFLLYYLEGSIMAQAFDPKRGRLKGDSPHRVAEHVALGSYQAFFDASPADTLVYMTNSATSEKRLKWFDRTGKDQGVTGEIQDYWDLRLSPDGKKLASNAGSPNSEIWVDELTRNVRMRFTIDPDTDQGVPVWSPDGNRIAFAKFPGKFPGGIYQKYSNGAGAEELLLADPDRRIWPTSWSRDGRFILYSREAAAPEDYAVWVLPMAGDRKPLRFQKAGVRAYDGQFSPDGRWVAYTSEQSGRGEVYIMPFEPDKILKEGLAFAGIDGGDRWQVSASGGRSPRWRSDGKEIFYLSQANQMMAAEVEEKGTRIAVRAARALFTCRPVFPTPPNAPYDVSGDGKKFVINSYSDDDTKLILVVNWTANLRKQ